MNNNPEQSSPAQRHEIYVPGHRPAKLAMMIVGIVMALLSLDKFGPITRLAFTGGRATGEAVRTVRTDAAGQETVYTSDADVLNAVKDVEEARDRESVFWVEYKFATEDGKPAEARSPIGQQVKPLYPLRDKDGLPSTISIWYNRTDPSHIVFPYQFGTWFMPGMLFTFGALCALMGLFLWRHASDPIEMPDLSRSHAELDKHHPHPH
jgi:hypothetical protein